LTLTSDLESYLV